MMEPMNIVRVLKHISGSSGCKMLKRNDVIMTGIVLLIALVSLGFFFLNKKEGSAVVITVNGEIYQQTELEQNNIIKIAQENGDYNEVVIQDGYVWMTDADCPDKLCVKHNKIHYNHETIVCLPHKVVVEIIGGEENNVDIIAK